MDPQKINFSDKWLQKSKVDDEVSQVYSVNILCEVCPNNEYSAYCKLCNKTFSITNMGFDQVVPCKKNCKA